MSTFTRCLLRTATTTAGIAAIGAGVAAPALAAPVQPEAPAPDAGNATLDAVPAGQSIAPRYAAPGAPSLAPLPPAPSTSASPFTNLPQSFQFEAPSGNNVSSHSPLTPGGSASSAGLLDGLSSFRNTLSSNHLS